MPAKTSRTSKKTPARLRETASLSSLPHEILRIIAEKLTEHDFPTHHLGMPPPCTDLLAFSKISKGIRTAVAPMLFTRRVCFRRLNDIDGFMKKWGHLAASVKTASFTLTSRVNGMDLLDMLETMQTLSGCSGLAIALYAPANCDSIKRRVRRLGPVAHVKTLVFGVVDGFHLPESLAKAVLCAFPNLQDILVYSRDTTWKGSPTQEPLSFPHLRSLRLPCGWPARTFSDACWTSISTYEASVIDIDSDEVSNLLQKAPLKSLIMIIPFTLLSADWPFEAVHPEDFKQLRLIHIRASNHFTLAEMLKTLPLHISDVILEGPTIQFALGDFLEGLNIARLRSGALRTITCLCDEYDSSKSDWGIDVLVRGFASFGIRLTFGPVIDRIEGA